MAPARRARLRSLAVFVIAAIPLVPDPQAPPARSADLDLELVRSAECQYRGITASFDKLTRAYALTAYQGAEWLGWEARPNPESPDTESLAVCRFRISGAGGDSAAGEPFPPDLRQRLSGTLEVTWRLNTLAAVQVHPHDDYAKDALAVFRRTVDAFVGRMVLLTRDSELRRSPADGGDPVKVLAAGTVLLRGERQGLWARVRVPSDTTAGWVLDELLLSAARPATGDGDRP